MEESGEEEGPGVEESGEEEGPGVEESGEEEGPGVMEESGERVGEGDVREGPSAEQSDEEREEKMEGLVEDGKEKTEKSPIMVEIDHLLESTAKKRNLSVLNVKSILRVSMLTCCA